MQNAGSLMTLERQVMPSPATPCFFSLQVVRISVGSSDWTKTAPERPGRLKSDTTHVWSHGNKLRLEQTHGLVKGILIKRESHRWC